jgi:predicted DsbA family dithiol-disulfide isomerase
MQIDIYADFTCPWCYIGKHRLAKALRLRPDLRPVIKWQPFQLNPDLPEDGISFSEYLGLKFGGAERAVQILHLIEETALRDGLVLDFTRLKSVPNTLAAHRLVRFAGQLGFQQTPFIDALYSAYFINGQDIGDLDILRHLGVQQGLPASATARFLDSTQACEAVIAADQQARQMGIQAVPCFVFNHRYTLAGAQEPRCFTPLFDIAVLEATEALSTPI